MTRSAPCFGAARPSDASSTPPEPEPPSTRFRWPSCSSSSSSARLAYAMTPTKATDCEAHDAVARICGSGSPVVEHRRDEFAAYDRNSNRPPRTRTSRNRRSARDTPPRGRRASRRSVDLAAEAGFHVPRASATHPDERRDRDSKLSPLRFPTACSSTPRAITPRRRAQHAPARRQVSRRPGLDADRLSSSTGTIPPRERYDARARVSVVSRSAATRGERADVPTTSARVREASPGAPVATSHVLDVRVRRRMVGLADSAPRSRVGVRPSPTRVRGLHATSACAAATANAPPDPRTREPVIATSAGLRPRRVTDAA